LYVACHSLRGYWEWGYPTVSLYSILSSIPCKTRRESSFEKGLLHAITPLSRFILLI